MNFATKRYEIDVANRPLVVEFSDLAEQANGSAIVKYGETIILATAVISENQREGISYFPLTVDYEEKFYAAGKILGSRFIRREGRPSEEAILNSRMIDRTLRPLFDKRIRNDIQIIATALSVDDKNDPDAIAIIASSLALLVSDIPWAGPVSAVRIGKVNNEYIVNPTFEQEEKSDLSFIISGKENKVNMIEGRANEVKEEEIVEVFKKSVGYLQKINEFQKKIAREIGKKKNWPALKENPKNMKEVFEDRFKNNLEKILKEPKNKKEQNSQLAELKNKWINESVRKFGPESQNQADIFFEEAIDEIIHSNIIYHERRPDGRKLDEIRPLMAKVGILPRTHGSGIFCRGSTHILSVATLGTPGDVLIVEGMEVQEKKRFMHHYNFPPFSAGETGRLGPPSRREIGHGALVEKGLSAVLPSKEEFPYTIRVVSETLSSNGSSSMASACASTLAMMDAGIPIKRAVAGIAMGLMMKDENNYKILTDIQGPEDHHGDTDFKATGTTKGITAIQMDVKVEGLTLKILEELLEKSRKARLQILEVMSKEISQPRKELSPYAPRIAVVHIKPEKIGEIIGTGGKTINKIIESCDVEIDIEEDGKIYITGLKEEGIQKAKKIIEDIVHEFQLGEVLTGKVKKIYDFGAVVEIPTRKEGLVHISELAPFRVEKVSDIIKVGDLIPVKIIKIEDSGKISLSLKQADPAYARRKNYSPKKPRTKRRTY
jgi:polyribonucleotide nucleotidyltransferase